jgi:protein-S-isoprenylcysteine O-methyltransferase Ste14
MNVVNLPSVDLSPWYALGIYWTISALRVKRTKVQEDLGGRLLHISLMGLAFLFLFSHRLDLGFLGQRFAPASDWLRTSGIVLTFVGAGIAIWARYSLGQYWSARVTLKVDHQLIRSGPYAWVRHPLYSGLLLAMAGSALVAGEWRAVVGFLLGLMEFSRKAAKEEVLLASEFGDQYQEFRKRTGFLAPRLR